LDLGASHLGHGETWTVKIDDLEKLRCDLQVAIDGAKTIDGRRKLGQFSTPPELSHAIVKETVPYLTSLRKSLHILEPSMGTGSFVSAALDILSDRVRAVRGYEIDPAFHAAAQELWKRCPVNAIQGDFTKTLPDTAFDLVLANPPYVRHHAFGIEEKHRLQALVKAHANVSISGLAGLYCHFLLFSKAWMTKDGIGVWLIPSEWMSVNYGSALRRFLSEAVTLLRVHQFDTTDVRFSDALVSSCVVWFKNCIPEGKSESLFTYGADIHQPTTATHVSAESLKSSDKWPPRQIKQDAGSWRIGDFFDIRRGVVTGDNTFFVLSEDKIAEKKIPRTYLRPILPSPRNLPVDHVTSDSDGLPTNAERRFLLDCSGKKLDELPENVRLYLISGENTTARKNLCASRDVWYEQEKRDPTPFLCSYMGRGAHGAAPVRFVLNDSRAIVSNSFLMMYPKSDLLRLLQADSSLAETVWSFLSRIPRDAIVAAGRSYGGGLQKVEPRELASIPCKELHAWVLANAKGDAFRYHTDDKGNMLLFEKPAVKRTTRKKKADVRSCEKRKKVKYPRHG